MSDAGQMSPCKSLSRVLSMSMLFCCKSSFMRGVLALRYLGMQNLHVIRWYYF